MFGNFDKIIVFITFHNRALVAILRYKTADTSFQKQDTSFQPQSK